MTREEILLQHLKEEGYEYDLDDIKECSWGENEFIVNEHKTRRGLSPEKAQELVKLVRLGLQKAFQTEIALNHLIATVEEETGETINSVDELKSKHISGEIYHLTKGILGDIAPELLQIGIHDLLNTLHHIQTGTESHCLTLREAFDGGKVTDRTTLETSSDFTFLVLTDEEAEERAAEYIKDSLWAFNPDFLERFAPEGVTAEVFEKLQPQCESANSAVLQLIGDNLEDLIAEAISSDGRGHFMCTYDGEEREAGEFFIYRT